MKFCSTCGHAVEYRVPPDDNRERAVCPSCHAVHYVNPRIVAGCVALHQDKLLIAKRSIDPRKGYWTLPAGFLELGESVEDGARRETLEEACAQVTVGPLLSMISVPHIGQVHMLFLATMRDGTHRAGPESLDTRLVTPDQIPWDDLAFPTIVKTLRHFCEMQASGAIDAWLAGAAVQPQLATIHWPPKSSPAEA